MLAPPPVEPKSLQPQGRERSATWRRGLDRSLRWLPDGPACCPLGSRPPRRHLRSNLHGCGTRNRGSSEDLASRPASLGRLQGASLEMPGTKAGKRSDGPLRRAARLPIAYPCGPCPHDGPPPIQLLRARQHKEPGQSGKLAHRPGSMGRGSHVPRPEMPGTKEESAPTVRRGGLPGCPSLNPWGPCPTTAPTDPASPEPESTRNPVSPGNSSTAPVPWGGAPTSPDRRCLEPRRKALRRSAEARCPAAHRLPPGAPAPTTAPTDPASPSPTAQGTRSVRETRSPPRFHGAGLPSPSTGDAWNQEGKRSDGPPRRAARLPIAYPCGPCLQDRPHRSSLSGRPHSHKEPGRSGKLVHRPVPWCDSMSRSTGKPGTKGRRTSDGPLRSAQRSTAASCGPPGLMGHPSVARGNGHAQGTGSVNEPRSN